MATTAALTEHSRQGINPRIPPCIGLGAWLSRNVRPGYGHAYDETPVGLVVYVRNDPVNLVDPDGKAWHAIFDLWDNEVLHVIGYYDWWENDGEGDPSVTPVGSDMGFNYIALRSDAKNIAKSDDCASFLKTLFTNARLYLATGGDLSMVTDAVKAQAAAGANQDYISLLNKLNPPGTQGAIQFNPLTNTVWKTGEGNSPDAIWDIKNQTIDFFQPFLYETSLRQEQIVIHETAHSLNYSAYDDVLLARMYGYKGSSEDAASQIWGPELEKHCK